MKYYNTLDSGRKMRKTEKAWKRVISDSFAPCIHLVQLYLLLSDQCSLWSVTFHYLRTLLTSLPLFTTETSTPYLLILALSFDIRCCQPFLYPQCSPFSFRTLSSLSSLSSRSFQTSCYLSSSQRGGGGNDQVVLHETETWTQQISFPLHATQFRWVLYSAVSCFWFPLCFSLSRWTSCLLVYLEGFHNHTLLSASKEPWLRFRQFFPSKRGLVRRWHWRWKAQVGSTDH